jgi:hypothetical protein
MVEMEVDDTMSSARVRGNDIEMPLCLDDLNFVQVNEKMDQTPQEGGFCRPIVPLTENYLKYCQNFKPKKPKSRKLAQKENERV